MSRHDPRITLVHMRDHAREAIALVVGRKRADLDSDRLLNLALVRLMEVVGEAAARMPPLEQARYPRVPWRQIVNLRNRLIHAYDRVDFDLLWQILKDDMPPLVVELDAILGPKP
jgi:uncharacterized protein with HEPN domain